MSNEIPSNPSLKISGPVLSKTLKAYRERRRQTYDETDQRLQDARDWWKANYSELQSTGSLPDKAAGIESLNDDLSVNVIDLEILAFSYNINRRMLDSLSAHRTSEMCVVVDSSEFDEIVEPALPMRMNRGSHYRLARHRLSKTEDVSIGHVVLDAFGGESDGHQHLGDELSIVLDGELEMELEDSGLFARLKKGSFLHFYAEQNHRARNKCETPAHCLVIRFHQTWSKGVRYELCDEFSRSGVRVDRFARKARDADKRTKSSAIKSVDKGARSEQLPEVMSRAYSEAMAAIMPFDILRKSETALGSASTTKSPVDFSDDNSEVHDRFGLGRMLMACAAGYAGRPRLTLDALKEKAKHRGFKRTRSWFDRLHKGLSRVTLGDLKAIAPIYEVGRVLLLNYAYPARRSAIAVEAEDGWDKVPASFFEDAKRDYEGVSYSLPRRRLAHSDIAICELSLEPGRSTPQHRHPGREMLLPLQASRFQLSLGGTTAVLETPSEAEFGRHVYAHFDSTIQHSVTNVGDEPARAMVIRFFS
jgi:quercetin dioxygenase-like cupin family protein